MVLCLICSVFHIRYHMTQGNSFHLVNILQIAAVTIIIKAVTNNKIIGNLQCNVIRCNFVSTPQV